MLGWTRSVDCGHDYFGVFADGFFIAFVDFSSLVIAEELHG
jgi:hypothetical protein